MSLSQEENGGYYAIKGFTYQFDKTLLEVLGNPEDEIEVEYIQDIGINNYYIQIKYKETQTYAPSKIRKAVMQLLSAFVEDNSLKFRLFCYFNDRSSQIVTLSEKDLNEILGVESDSYTDIDKKLFIDNFKLEFSEDYESQFRKLIKLIREKFSLTTDEEATVHHASIRSALIEVALKRKGSDRKINTKILKDLVSKNEKIIFELAHYKYLKLEKYTTYLKNEYFTFKKPNIPNTERLFIIDVNPSAKESDLIEIINNIQHRYFKKDTSPAPYINLRGLGRESMISLKQRLWDLNMFFNDGTNFNEDRFRIKDLAGKVASNSRVTFKIIGQENLLLLLKDIKIDEIYAFLTHQNDGISAIPNVRDFYIEKTRDIIKIIKP